ncbi:MAG TPA: hydantoinase/oxoprolinase family protein [Gammaproteobacteria bacterium]|nr:hydantoinase/oxoprolinase family protein [Gammaproteobacteria bacterium]
MTYRIAVDTGGTFTDAVVADASGILALGKALTDPERNFTGVQAAIADAAAQLGRDPRELLAATDVFIYGTTRATNAIVTRRTARTAMLLTEGFPDILVYRQGGKLRPHELTVDYPDPYVPRHLTFEIPERIDAEGGVVTPLDEARTRAVLEELAALKVEAVAVCLLWSIANPAHERRVAELIAEHLPGVPYTLSHALNPVLREYPRASSTAIDASLKPLMQEQLRLLERNLAASGYTGELLVSASLGGVMHVEDMIGRPIHLVKSGPAMAPIAGLSYAALEELGEDVVVVDTGGTTFDVSLVRNGQVSHTRETWLGEIYTGHLLGMGSVDVRSIGAGGGSIAWLDAGGLLRVGPHSAGARPGPACYGAGGEEPTVTDAAVVLGYLNPAHFLGGRMALDPAAARRVMAPIAARLGKSIEDSALAIVTVANENMIKAIQEITVKEGFDPADAILVAGGGAAGLNILPIARALGMRRVLIPRTAGALSACGALFSDMGGEAGASRYATTAEFDFAAVDALLDRLERELDEFARSLAARGLADFSRSLAVEARYAGQIWELEVPLRGRLRTAADLAALIEDFHLEHERVFAVRDPDNPIECIHWRARLRAALPRGAQRPLPQGRAGALHARAARTAYFGLLAAAPHAAAVFHGEDLAPGDRVSGPAIIEEPTTTLVVYPGTTVTVTPYGHYLCALAGPAATDAQGART